MPADDQAKVSLEAFVDEAWGKFDRNLLQRSIFKAPEISADSKWFDTLPPAISKQPKPSLKELSQKLHFDTEFFAKDIMYYNVTGHVDRDVRNKLDVKELTNKIYDELGLPRELQYNPTIKENNMSDRSLRSPESPIETKDLTVAIRTLGAHDLDYLLDAVALVQDLESNQRLARAEKIKQQDLGSHLQIIDGVGGVLTDLRDYHNFGRQDNGMVKAVVGGKMIELRPSDFVVLTALAN